MPPKSKKSKKETVTDAFGNVFTRQPNNALPTVRNSPQLMKRFTSDDWVVGSQKLWMSSNVGTAPRVYKYLVENRQMNYIDFYDPLHSKNAYVWTCGNGVDCKDGNGGVHYYTNNYGNVEQKNILEVVLNHQNDCCGLLFDQKNKTGGKQSRASPSKDKTLHYFADYLDLFKKENEKRALELLKKELYMGEEDRQTIGAPPCLPPDVCETLKEESALTSPMKAYIKEQKKILAAINEEVAVAEEELEDESEDESEDLEESDDSSPLGWEDSPPGESKKPAAKTASKKKPAANVICTAEDLANSNWFYDTCKKIGIEPCSCHPKASHKRNQPSILPCITQYFYRAVKKGFDEGLLLPKYMENNGRKLNEDYYKRNLPMTTSAHIMEGVAFFLKPFAAKNKGLASKFLREQVIPNKLMCLHMCGNGMGKEGTIGSCSLPHHLFWGTTKQNRHDELIHKMMPYQTSLDNVRVLIMTAHASDGRGRAGWSNGMPGPCGTDDIPFKRVDPSAVNEFTGKDYILHSAAEAAANEDEQEDRKLSAEEAPTVTDRKRKSEQQSDESDEGGADVFDSPSR